MRSRKYALVMFFGLTALLTGGKCFGQTGDGQPVTASPFVKVNIDERRGCVNIDAKTGKELERPAPRLFCADFQIARTFQNDKAVEAAEQECIKFYEIALRLQNIICSYNTDSEEYEKAAGQMAKAEGNEKQNPSRHVVAGANRALAGINKKYIEKLAEVGQQIYDQFPRYTGSLGKLSGQAGADILKEATCRGLKSATNLNINGRSPGYLRQLLEASADHAARITYRTIFGSVRENIKNLRAAKEEAEANDRLTKPSELVIPARFAKAMAEELPSENPKTSLTAAEGAVYGVVQYGATEAAKKLLESPVGKALGASLKLAPIIGAAATMGWQIHTNRLVTYLEVGASFLGVWKLSVGFTANVLVGFYRVHRGYEADYLPFSHEQLKRNVNMSAGELVTAWGEKAPRHEACIESGKMESECDAARMGGMATYSGSACAKRGWENPGVLMKRSP